MSPTLPSIEDTIIVASQAHKDSLDKIGEPYILHPIRVMLSMVTPLERTVALLHDVVEDTNITLESLRALRYPEVVIDAIDSISRRSGETWEDFIKRCSLNPMSRKVKLADISDNMSPIRQYRLPPDDRDRMQKKYLWAKQYIHSYELEVD